MSQHDQNIANDTGAAVRGDINNALAALFGLSSGASAPSTTIAYMLWADTTSGLLKQRNAANTGWLVRGTLAETFVVARSSNTILGVGDHSRIFVATSTFTQTLTAAATLGDGWWCGYRNDGSGVITIDPNASETIDGGTTITLQPGEACLIYCNGSAFKTIGRRRINDLTEDTTPVASDDYVETWDASASAHKKVKLANIPTGLTKLASGTVAAAATLDIAMTGYTAYRNKVLVANLIPATDGVVLNLRTSTDGGSSYAAGASDYGWEASVGGSTTTTNDSAIGLTVGGLVGNGAAEGIGVEVTLFDTIDTAKWTRMKWEACYVDSAGTPVVRSPSGGGARRAAQDTDAIRLLFSSGNIASGNWALYGFN